MTNDKTKCDDRYRQELSREISPAHNVLITLSAITPAASVFVIVPAVISTAGTGSILAMIFAAIVCVLMAFCWAELGAAYPTAGGDYPLVYHAFKGPFEPLRRPFSFMSFVLWLITGIFGFAVISLGITQYIPVAKGLDPAALGAALTIIATLIAILRIRLNAMLTGTFLILELFALAVLVVLGITHFHLRVAEMLNQWVVGTPRGGLTTVPFTAIPAAAAVAIYAYNGFNSAIWFSEETRGHSRGIASAVLWSLAIAVATELIPTMALIFGAADVGKITTSAAPMSDFILATSGPTLNAVVSIGIALAIFNAMIANVLSFARIMYAAARDRAYFGALNGWMARVHPRSQAPWVATLAVGLITATLCLTVSEATLISLTGAGLVFAYAFVAVSAVVGRVYGATSHGPYKMPLWPLPPVVAFFALIYIATQQPAKLLLVTLGELALAMVWWIVVISPKGAEAWTLKQPNYDVEEVE